MPQIQNVDSGEADTSPLTKTIQGFVKRDQELRSRDSIEDLYKKYKDDGNNIDTLIQGYLTNPNLGPTERVQGLDTALKMRQQNVALQKKSSSENLAPDEREARVERLVLDGMPRNEAELFIDAPKGTQQRIWAGHQERKDRKNRIPEEEQQAMAENQPQPQSQSFSNQAQNQNQLQQGQNAQSPVAQSGPEEWPAIPLPTDQTPKELAGLFKDREKQNNESLKELNPKVKAARDMGIRLKRLGQLSEKVPDGWGRAVINPETGQPYPLAQIAKLPGVTRDVEAYVKTLNDFIIDAKDYFGSRVTNFDLSSFQSRLPNLTNSAAGRRTIIKQMDLMNQLQVTYEKELADGLRHYGGKASFNDIDGLAQKRVADKEAGLINQLDNLVLASDQLDKMAANPEKFKGYELFQTPKGNFRGVPKAEVEQAKAKGWIKY